MLFDGTREQTSSRRQLSVTTCVSQFIESFGWACAINRFRRR